LPTIAGSGRENAEASVHADEAPAEDDIHACRSRAGARSLAPADAEALPPSIG
jgi:hypothetical protein